MGIRCVLAFGLCVTVISLSLPAAASDDALQGKRGRLVGRFVYDGQPPKPEHVGNYHAISLANEPSREPVTGQFYGVELAYRDYLQRGIRPSTIDRSLLVSGDGGIANIVVFAVSKDMPVGAGKQQPETVRLHIKDGQFTPRVLAMAATQTLVIENRDDLGFGFHLSATANPAVNMIIPPKSERRATFSKPERFLTSFRSDQQIWATGILLVHGNHYFGISDADGKWSIPDLPPGDWEFAAWHERSGYLKNRPKGRFTHEIKHGENDLGTVKLSPDMFKK